VAVRTHFHRIDWSTPGLDARLVQLHSVPSVPFTMRRIAAILSEEFDHPISRNAVIGRCRRLGLPNRDDDPNERPPEEEPPPPPGWPEPWRELPPQRNGSPVTFYQLHRDGCKWPTGAWPDIWFCGRPAFPGGVYCGEHYRIAYNVTPRSR
jgi:hypothetical protein